MIINPSESWEEKRRKLNAVNGSARFNLLGKLLNGETVDLASDPSLYYAAFGKAMPMEDFVNRVDKNRDAQVQQAKTFKELNKSKDGYTDKKRMRHVGEIPADIFFTRPEFHQDNPNRAENIRKFLNEFPAFRTVDKPL